jgi:GH25 family lysozyme M1 (1,4-beta-N-acetylmuramidase)
VSNQPIVAIDLSHHNSIPHFADACHAARADGLFAVILKATEGVSHIDEMYASRRADAARAGLIVFSYHFLKHGRAAEQMLFYLSAAAPAQGERVVIDYEDAALDIGDLIQAVGKIRMFRPDVQITVYGASKLAEDARGHAAQLVGTSLWAARYSTSEPVIANDVWPVWSLWQFTDKAQTSYFGVVDANRFNGSTEQARAWLSPAEWLEQADQGKPEAADPQPEPQQTLVAITAPPGSNVVVTINGNVVTAG